jgi:hypothetical protein
LTREHLGTEMCWAVGDDVCNHASSAAVSNMRALQETESEHAHGVRRDAPTYTRARNAAAARRSARHVTYRLETGSRASKNSREGKAPPDAAGGVPKVVPPNAPKACPKGRGALEGAPNNPAEVAGVVPPNAAAPKACPKGCGALEGAPNNPWAGEDAVAAGAPPQPPVACPKGRGELWAGEPNEATCTAAGVWLGRVKPGAAGWPNKEVGAGCGLPPNILLPAELLEAAGAPKPTVPTKPKPDPDAAAAGALPQPELLCCPHMAKRCVLSSGCCACAGGHFHSLQPSFARRA